MAKKIGIIVLLCFSLCVGGVSAFANEGHDETDTQTLIETQPPVSSVLFRQDGADIQQSTDEGKTWQSYSPIEETDYFTYDEFSAWIENETENIQKLVDAGEWTEAEATEALEYYDEILKSILEGKMVGKRASSSDDQLFFSMPDNAQPEQYQTFVFDGNTYKSIGPFDTEEELFNALKEYTDMLFERLYEDNVAGKIDDARFAKMSKRYEQEQGENAKKIKALRLELKKDESKRMDIDDFLETVRRYTDAATITKRMVAELIDHIEVYHAEKQDGITNQRVVIHYNCIGAFDVPDRRKIPEADIIMETRKGVALSYAPEQVAV